MKKQIRVWEFVCVLGAVCVTGAEAQSRSGGTAAEPEAPGKARPTSVEPTGGVSLPRLIKFSGLLKDRMGQPRSGIVGVTFALYQDQQGGAPLWLEVQNLELDDQGRYTVLLGATQTGGLPLELFAAGRARWLGVQVQGEEESPEASGRILLVSVPYALKAADAETLGGKPASAFVLSDEAKSGGTGVSGTGVSPVSLLSGPGSTKEQVTGTGTTNFITKFTSTGPNPVVGNSLLFDDGTKVGLGTITPAVPLQINVSNPFAGTVIGSSALSVGSVDIVTTDAQGVNVGPLLALGGNRATTGTNLGVFGGIRGAKENSTDGNTAGYLGFYTLQAGVGFGERMRISSSGLVGMGTLSPNPGARLTLVGGLHMRGAVADVTVPDGENLQLGHLNFLGGLFTERLRITPTGNVGIGTTTPSEKLHVVGNVLANGSMSATSFAGSGAGLTSLTAANLSAGTAAINISGNAATATTANNALALGGVPTASFARLDVGNSFTGNQTVAGTVHALGVARGVVGRATFSTEQTFGVEGIADSTSGTGVEGVAQATTGATVGVRGHATASPDGIGVVGSASAGTGSTIGVRGVVQSLGGTAGVFDNVGGGKLLSGRSGPTLNEVFRVDGSGTVSATSFVGSGAGLTNLNPASLGAGTAAINISGSAATATTANNALALGGVPAASFARLDIGNAFSGDQSITGNLTATGSLTGTTASFSADTANTVLSVTQSLGGGGRTAVLGQSTAGFDRSIGVRGEALSTDGVGVQGTAFATTGAASGVRGESMSTEGTGVLGQANATTGATFGVRGNVASPSGTAGEFWNPASGKILSGRSGSLLTEVFRVDGSGNVVASGSVSGSQLVSTVADGTAPLSLTSTTKVTNLNADLLDGIDSTAFATTSALTGFVSKAGDTMTGTLTLPANGLVAGTNQLALAGGNVGIGTAAPGPLVFGGTAKLDVAGAVRITNPANLEGLYITSAGDNVTVRLEATSVGGHRYSLHSAGGNSGFGQGVFVLQDETAGGRLRIEPNGDVALGGTMSSTPPSITGAHIVTKAGNVGIGTTTPAEKLEVAGNVKAASFIGSGAGLTSLSPASLSAGTAAINISGNAATATTANNALALGGTPAANYARLDIGNTFTGDQSITGSVSATGLLSLPATTGASAGVITFGGSRFVHNFGPNNTFVGAGAGNFTMTGNDNTASGFQALQNNTTGWRNTASGMQALFANTTGSQNTATGWNALFSNTGGLRNTASGMQALFSNTTGGSNTASGMQALQGNTTGNENTASGAFALSSNTTGNFNTASGMQALQGNTTGINNTASGAFALGFNTTGVQNTAIGVQAGVTANTLNPNTTGSNNTFIGFNSGPGTATQLTNATAIGANALVSASNALVLGDGAVNVGIGTAAPGQKLDVVGNILASGSVTATSFTGSGSGLTNVTASSANDLACTGCVAEAELGFPVATQAELDAEAAARAAADTTLQTNLNNEAAARQAADAALQSGIDGKVAKAGDTMTGTLNLPALVASGSVSGATGSFSASGSHALTGSSTGLVDGAGVRGIQTGPQAGFGVWGSGAGIGVLGDGPNTGVRGTADGRGVRGDTFSTTGIGVEAMASANTGATMGVRGTVQSASGLAGVFDNTAGGKILSGRVNNVEKFSVDGSGNVVASGSVTAASFTGGGAGLTGVTASSANDLACTGCVAETELSFDPATQAELDAHKSSTDHDARYAQLAAANSFTGSQSISVAVSAGNALLATNTWPSGSTNGVQGRSDSTSGTGVLGYASASSGPTTGVQGLANGPSGVGVAGQADSIGVRGSTQSLSGMGVQGWAVQASGSTIGVQGKVGSASGTAGVFDNTAAGKILSGQVGGAEKFSVDGSGNVVASGTISGTTISGSTISGSGGSFSGSVSLTASVGGGNALLVQNTFLSGSTNGVQGRSDSTSGTGVLGYASASSGPTTGVQGLANGPSGVGVAGQADSIGVRGSTQSLSGMGVQGWAVQASGSTIGVQGKVGSASGTAGVFDNTAAGKILSGQVSGAEKFSVSGSGNVTASGTVESTSGGFKFPDGSTQTKAAGIVLYIGASQTCPASFTLEITNVPAGVEGNDAVNVCSSTSFTQVFYIGSTQTCPAGWNQVDINVAVRGTIGADACYR